VTSQSDYDSPWKDVLDLFFEDCVEFFFPQAHARIDWSRGFEFLDKELQKITADAAIGRRAVDKLVKVWLKSGQEFWVLIHIEVQGEREADFELRVYIYNFRGFDRFGVPVATFVLLTDDDENWRPTEYQSELLGTELRFKFPAVKFTDYRTRWDELERSLSPFAVIVQGQLIARQTRHNPPERMQRKLSLTKRLYQRGFDKLQIIGLYRFLDWILMLPDALSAEFKDKLNEYEEEQKMKYVTSIERMGIAQGKVEGRVEGRKEAMLEIALQLLPRRYGPLDEDVQAHINALPVEQIKELIDALFDSSSSFNLEDWLQQHPLIPISALPPAEMDSHNGAA
jgi:hypothetical protein